MATRLLGFDVMANDHGVCHADELFLMFKQDFGLPFETDYTDTDKAVGKRLVKMWVTFANDLKPSTGVKEVEWKRQVCSQLIKNSFQKTFLFRSDPKDPKLLYIDSELRFAGDTDDRKKRLSSWEKIWKEVPPTLHLKTTKSWKNSKLYNKGAAGSSGKEEL